MLVSLVSLIFANILPGVRATAVQLYVAIALVIVVNAFLSHWLALRGRGWESIAREFVVMAAANLGLVYLAAFLLRQSGGALSLQVTLFFVLLLTLIVTLYDRYRVVYAARFAHPAEAVERELRRVQLEAALEASAGAWQDADHPELADGPAIDRWIAKGRTQLGWDRPEAA